jgi:hypothetical protein
MFRLFSFIVVWTPDNSDDKYLWSNVRNSLIFFLKIMPKLSVRAIWELINICIVSFGHTFMLNFYDSIPARRTGYICGDPWLSLPYKGYPPLYEELILVIELSMFAIVSNFNTSYKSTF